MKLLFVFFLIQITCLFSDAHSQCNLKMNSNVYSSVLNSTGNSTLDKMIITESSKLERTFGVNADFNICTGSSGLAMASCKSSNCDGTIELGKDLLNFEYKKACSYSSCDMGKWMVVAVLAHEIAHIIQYSHKMRFTSTVQQEIHADILAGWYIAKYMDEIMTDHDRYFGRVYDDIKFEIQMGFGFKGDKEYWSPYHHGNYLTRLSAVESGISQYERGFRDWEKVFFRWGPGDAQSIIDKWNKPGNHFKN